MIEQVWAEQARARIRALWRARHNCIDARQKVHYWVRILRLTQGASHKRRLLCERN